MIRSRWQLWSVVAVLALAVLVVPGVALAAPLAGSTQVDSPQQPTFSIPGVLTLTLGQGFTNTGQEAKLDMAEIQFEGVNAVARISGLTLGPNFVPTGWDSIALTQNAPLMTTAYTIADAQVSVGGAGSGYSTLVSANLDLHPNSAVQVNGTFGVAYDGLARAFGVGVRDGAMAIQAGPVNVTATALNTGPGTMTLDTLDATVAATGTSLNIAGLSFSPRGLDWDTLDVKQPPAVIGNAVSIAPFTLRVGGSATGYSTAAVVGMGLQAGEAVQVQGELVTVYDGMTRQAVFGVQNANATVALSGWNLAVQGLDVSATGSRVDTVTMNVAPLNLTAEVNGLAVNQAGQFMFDEAMVRYEPQGQPGMAGGFQMTMTRQDEGYVLTTTTILPTAQR